jgi:hypothetical protein
VHRLIQLVQQDVVPPLFAQGPDDTEYKQTGYFARMSAAKAGFPERGEHTSSSLLDLASHDAPQADGAQAAPQ